MVNLNERIKNVMGAVFEIDPKMITDTASPGDVEKWDSLRHMNLVLALEDEFKVRFPDEVTENLISLKLIELSLNELLPKKD